MVRGEFTNCKLQYEINGKTTHKSNKKTNNSKVLSVICTTILHS